MSIQIARGLLAWEAPGQVGRPICVADPSDDPNSLSVNLYVNDKGILVGVCVYDEEGEFMSAAGLLPLEVINDERQYLYLPPVESQFYPAEMIYEGHE